MRLRSPRASDLLLIGASLIAGLIFVEVGLRAYLGQDGIISYRLPAVPDEASAWVDHPFLPYIGRPHAEYPSRGEDPEVPAIVRNNAWGFRSHEFPLTRSAEDYLIVALGGSTSWGAGAASNSGVWPERLEARLQGHFPERRIRVFNLGTNGATTAYNVIVLALVAAHLSPDLVLVYHGFNDIMPANQRSYRYDHAHAVRDLAIDSRWQGIQRMFPEAARTSYAFLFLTAQIDVFLGVTRLSHYTQKWRLLDIRLDPRDLRAAIARNWQHLVSMARIAEGHGAAILFSTFQFFDGAHLTHRYANETLRETFAEHGLDYVDIDALIDDGDRSLQYDECHFTAAGEARMAEIFFAAIVERGLIERRAAF